jgi:PleD family two-component response regulator
MNKPVIICIDDEPTVIESLKIELKKAVGNECIIETAEGGKDALELVNELLAQGSEVAVVLSDYIMPDIKGDEVLSKIHTLSPNTLKIMLTGQASLEAVGKAIQNARLYRYIAKPWQPEDLKLTIIEAVHSYLQDKKLTEQNIKLKSLNAELERLNQFQAEIIAERTAALEEVNRELRRLVNLDGLTILANRRHFDEYLLQEWTRLSREESPLSLVLCDVDFFKQYNDTLGHLLGDDCLKAIAKALAAAAKRPADLVARYGGEEFAMILPNTKGDGAY